MKNFLESLDFNLLRNQKLALLELKGNENQMEAVSGIVGLIDKIQDIAVDEYGYEESEVFFFLDSDWICTDSSNNQYGRQTGRRTFEFKQDIITEGITEIVQTEIDLDDYTLDEINNHLSPYGWDVDQLLNENDSNVSAEWLMAECIFEQTIFDYI
jgi:hypothetical protein